MDRMNAKPYDRGVIPSEGFIVVALNDAPLPCSCSLMSTSGSRGIAYSPDGISWYTTATYDGSTTGAITWGSSIAMSHVRFTGAVNDRYEIR